MFLREITANAVLPSKRIPKARSAPCNVDTRYFRHVGWLYTDMARLREHFEPITDATETACCAPVFASRLGRWTFYLTNKTTKPIDKVQTWAVVCAPEGADNLLRDLASLCSARVTKMLL
eukprot:6351319-Karenia_brevis.AAC.1